jgi:hypothetical protein
MKSLNSNKRDRIRKKTSTVSLTQNEITVESEKKFFEDDNNYIDYFMEIGAKPDIFKFNFLYEAKSPEEISENLIPQIICKFPISDKRNIVVENVMINQVFPQGFKVLVSEKTPNPEFYCVVLDNQLYSAIYTRKYLACLVIYESIESYQKLNEKFKLEDNKFMVILRSTMKAARPKVMSIDNNDNSELNNWYIPKCLCIVSVHPYINKYKEILNTIYDLILSNKYPSLFLDHIIERLIVQTPKIPRGHKRIMLKFPNKNIEISEKKMNEMPLVNVNFCRLFDVLSINNVIEIFKYLLYETKLIFFSESLPDLTNTIISFLFLLSPFKYQFQIVSVLSKELYNYAETISPFIFGINEKYTDTFFSKNKIAIEDTTICVVDIDNNNHYIIAPGGQIDLKDYPEMPKKLRKKLEDKLKKNSGNNSDNGNENNNLNINNENDFKARNERYQAIFFKIMIHILKDYPKFLSKDYSVNKDISMSIKDMIDLKSYLNMFNNTEKYFYSRIFNTQMFMEFIYKRMMPKNCNEKVEVLFFEEKIKEKTSSKMIFGKSKLLDQNVLLTCKDYDYDKDIEIIDLRPNKDLEDKLNTYLIDRKNYILKFCLNKGFSVAIDEERKKSTFYYYLFPSLLSDKLFILNAELYKTPPHFYKEVDAINMKIVNKSYLKFIQNIQTLKNSESQNDLYLCYLIIWAVSMGYTESTEREYRFYEMLEMLEKIEEHDIKIFEIIFKNLVEFSEDKNIILLYKIFINLRLNPSWEMFSLVSKIIKKKQNASNKKSLLHQSIDPHEYTTQYKNEKKTEFFHRRCLKNDESDDFIFSNSLIFYAYFKCERCKSSINVCELCNLGKESTSIVIDKDKNGHERLKCKAKLKNNKVCDGIYEPKLKFRFGEELFNQKDIYNLMNKRKTSTIKEIKLLLPSELKEQLMQIVSNLNKKEKFDIEMLRFNYPNVFWSLIFYFDLNDIDKSFMLPYSNFDSNKVLEKMSKEKKVIIKSKEEENENENEKDKLFNIDLKITKNFNFKKFFLQNNEIKKYDNDNLCIQNVYDLGLINNILYSYKNIFSYEENIGYNELPIIIFEKENNSYIAKRSSAIVFNENDTFNNFIVRDSILPFNKRNSDANIICNLQLRMSKGDIPLDNRLLIKKRNPLEEHIFDFESSEDDFDDDSDKGKVDSFYSHKKSKTLDIDNF